jgi:hypothetical protein
MSPALPHTAHWTETLTHAGERGSCTVTSNHWLRLDPPAYAWLNDLGDHDVIDERGHLHTSDTWTSCLQVPSVYQSPEDFQRHILPWGPRPAPEAEARRRDQGWEWQQDTVDGRPAVRWRRRCPEGSYQVEMSVWLEPETGLLLRLERTEIDPATGRVAVEDVQHGFQYDVEPPDGVFDLPPPGKPLVTEDLSTRFPDLTETLRSEERAEIEALIARSDAAWLTADARAFFQAWDFPRSLRGSPVPSKRDWESRLRSNAGRWKRWDSTVTSIKVHGHVAVAVGSHSFSIVNIPGALRVAAALYVERAGDGRPWGGDASYYLHKGRNGYRILHWEYPAEELRVA